MSTTPQTQPRSRSASRTRKLPSQPNTPVRPSSRNSLRASQTAAYESSTAANSGLGGPSPLDALEPSFAELSDSLADLEANMLHLQLMHESVSRFGESFAAFLYGMNMNAFCVDFVEAPVQESWVMAEKAASQPMGGVSGVGGGDGDATFLTTDTSFIEHPPLSTKSSSKFSTPAPSSRTSNRGTTRGRGGIPRASSIARGTGRGTRGTRGR